MQWNNAWLRAKPSALPNSRHRGADDLEVACVTRTAERHFDDLPAGTGRHVLHLDPFAGQKTTATIDVITTGLASDYTMGLKMHKTFIKELLSFDDNQTWESVLEKIERPIPGVRGSYLLNVGGV